MDTQGITILLNLLIIAGREVMLYCIGEYQGDYKLRYNGDGYFALGNHEFYPDEVRKIVIDNTMYEHDEVHL